MPSDIREIVRQCCQLSSLRATAAAIALHPDDLALLHLALRQAEARRRWPADFECRDGLIAVNGKPIVCVRASETRPGLVSTLVDPNLAYEYIRVTPQFRRQDQAPPARRPIFRAAAQPPPVAPKPMPIARPYRRGRRIVE